MNLHEFQGKALFAEYGLPVSNGKVIYDAEDALKACRDIGGSKWVVKAQVHAGGRGKSGGVKLVEECTDISSELYLSAVIDRDSQRVVFIGSSEGGVNIEEVAQNTPDKIIYEAIDPLCGAQGFQARKIAKVLKLNSAQTKQFTPMLKNLMRLFVEKDLSLLEINPLVITNGGNLHCLDAKINIDANAIYRQPQIAMVNGAGLAMGTMDTIKYFGGNPANFLDVGGTATQERVSKAFKIILDDPEVKVVLVNIFGGIVRCDLIAEGVIAAIEEVGVEIPVVVRLEGNNADLGSEILSEAGIKIESINNLGDAAKKAVELAK